MGELNRRIGRLEANYAEELEQRFRTAWATGTPADLARVTKLVFAHFGQEGAFTRIVAWSGIPEEEWLAEVQAVLRERKGT